MPDPMTLGIIATSAAYVSKPALEDFLKKVMGPLGTEIGSALADPLREWRAKHVAATFQGAKEHLESAEIEPQPVPPRLLIPLAEAASLEDDPSLTARWSALLANAAAGSRGSRVHPRYVSILQQITVEDAVILDYLGQRDLFAPSLNEQDLLDTLNLDEQNYYRGLDALVSLGLVDRQSLLYDNETNAEAWLFPGERLIYITQFGSAFLSAVSAPSRAS